MQATHALVATNFGNPLNQSLAITYAVKLKSVNEDLLLSVERDEWGYLCLSVVLDTKQAPQSQIGRFNKVIGGVYQDTDVVEKGLGVQMRKGVVKVSDKRENWTEVGVDKEGLRVMSIDECWVLSTDDDDEWWWGVGESASTKDWTQVLEMGAYRFREGVLNL